MLDKHVYMLYNTGDRLVVKTQISEAALTSKPTQNNVTLPVGTQLKVTGQVAGGGIMVESAKPVQTVQGTSQTMFLVPPQILGLNHLGVDDAVNMTAGGNLTESVGDFMTATAKSVDAAIPSQKGATPDLRRTNAPISGENSSKDFMGATKPAKDGQKDITKGAVIFTDISVKENWDACIEAGTSGVIEEGLLEGVSISSELSGVTANTLSLLENTFAKSAPKDLSLNGVMAAAVLGLGARFCENDDYIDYANWGIDTLEQLFESVEEKLPFMEQNLNNVEAELVENARTARVLGEQGALSFVETAMFGLAGRLRLVENAEANSVADIFEMIAANAHVLNKEEELGDSFSEALDSVDAYYSFNEDDDEGEDDGEGKSKEACKDGDKDCKDKKGKGLSLKDMDPAFGKSSKEGNLEIVKSSKKESEAMASGRLLVEALSEEDNTSEAMASGLRLVEAFRAETEVSPAEEAGQRLAEALCPKKQ